MCRLGMIVDRGIVVGNDVVSKNILWIEFNLQF